MCLPKSYMLVKTSSGKTWFFWGDAISELSRCVWPFSSTNISLTQWVKDGRAIRELNQMRFWATHVIRKSGSFHFRAPWRYQICISKCLYYYRGDLPKIFGQNRCRKMKKDLFRLTCVAQKRLCLTSLIAGETRFLLFPMMRRASLVSSRAVSQMICGGGCLKCCGKPYYGNVLHEFLHSFPTTSR